MSALGIQALLAVLLGAAAFVYVASRGKNEIRPGLLSVLGGLVVWMGGKLVMDLASSDAMARTGYLISYLGACGMGPAWLLLATRFTRPPLFERRPLLLVAACVPAALTYLALLTNDGHRMFSDIVSMEMLAKGMGASGGPIFWANLTWQLCLVAIGIVMFLRYASRSLSVARRTHAKIVAIAGSIPVATVVAKHTGLLPEGFDPVPLVTALGVAATIGIVVRYRLLDSLPMARRDVIEALDDAVILTDAYGMVLDLNPAAHALLGAASQPPRDQPVARILAGLASDPERQATEARIDAALESADAVTVPLLTRENLELEITLGSVLDRAGEPSARFAVVRDLTESRRHERLLRESQQRVVVGGIAAALAHEVNNPLAFVASNLRQIYRVASFEDAELAPFEKSRATELEELAEVVEETIEGVERIGEIIGRIIRPASLSESEVVRLDLGAVVEDAVRLVALHGRSAVRTRVAPAQPLPETEGCPEQLSQALLNLLLNAQSAAESVSGASLFIDAIPDGEGVAVRLAVRGPGDSPWHSSLPLIAPPDPTAEAELSAAYATVREHGGTLETGGEAGLLFVLRLPAAS